MKKIFIFCLIPLFQIFGEDLCKQNGFVVMELFTSQGCSSCPSADNLMSELQNNYGANFYALSFHVDYWNYIGWKDPYSKEEFTKRQENYSRKFFSNSYTPQAVINGSAHFVGSDRSSLNQIINQNINSEQKTESSVEVKRKNNELILKYNKICENINLKTYIALVLKSVSNKVSKGENAGKALKHIQVVQELYSVSLSELQKNKYEWKIPFSGSNSSQYKIITFQQNPESMEILSAAMSEIKE